MKDHLIGPILGVFAVAFCSVVLAQNEPSAFPRDGARKAAENPYFAIWDVTFQKDQSSGMRRLNLDQIYVFMNDGPVKFTKVDGTWTIEEEKMGSVRYASRGTVESEVGVEDKPVRAFIFQLKDATPPRRERVEGIPNKFEGGRLGVVKLFETDRVTVYDYTWIKGMKTPRHLHYSIDAAVYLVEGASQVVGSSHVSNWKVGQVLAGTRALSEPHVEQWVEGEPRAIAIELK